MKAKDSKRKHYTLCWANIWKYFKINKIEKTGLKRNVKLFSVDFNAIDPNNILHIHIYLTKGTQYKMTFQLIKKAFIGLLISINNACNYTKCALTNNQKYMTLPSLINLHPNGYSQNWMNVELHYYLFAVILDTIVGSCNLLITYLKKYVFQIKQ